MTPHLIVLREFTRTPGGRYYTDGPFSGQWFREEVLLPALAREDLVLVDLNGVRGLPSSFIDESFGVLVDLFGLDEAQRRVMWVLTDNQLGAQLIPKRMLLHHTSQAA